MLDLAIVNAALPSRQGYWDIGIVDEKIAYIRPATSSLHPPSQDLSTESGLHSNDSSPSNGQPNGQPNDSVQTTLDARGHLVIPGLADAHFHLDKVSLLRRCVPKRGDFKEAMEVTLAAKREFTLPDIQARASRHIEQAIAFGTSFMRSHVEVDPTIRLLALEALLPLRDRYAWGIDIQLAVFAQEGITHDSEIPDLLRQAMAAGGDVIGSAPYVDASPAENIRTIFDIAEEFDCDVDFHLDFLDDDKPLLAPVVIEETQRRGWQGRVCLGHMTKLAALSPEELQAIAKQLAEAGISVLALPASDLYMMARQDSHNVRRGVAPVHTLAAHGVNVGLATNNVQNLFTPFGDGDLLKICTLLAQVLHLGNVSQHHLCLEMATQSAAQAMGIKHYGLTVGHSADLVILGAETVSEAVGSAPIERTILKKGRIVAQNKLERQFFVPSEA